MTLRIHKGLLLGLVTFAIGVLFGVNMSCRSALFLADEFTEEKQAAVEALVRVVERHGLLNEWHDELEAGELPAGESASSRPTRALRTTGAGPR